MAPCGVEVIERLNMIRVVGIRFRNAGKIYFFAPGDFDLKRGTPVIVETARGIEFGTCVNNPSEVTDDQVVSPLKPILRIATERDVKQAAENKEKEKEAFKTCQTKIREHELEMKLIDAEYTFDNSKILFYFTADGRVDFRELVKDLAAIFRTRIELRQVGVRDETKILGGIGICGRPLCCHSYLSDFVPVSIKMAKEQNLSLNPTKISGVCGRLMCCLKNEEEVYEEQNRKLPGVGDYVTTSAGERGVVTGVNIFHETVKVLVQNGDEKELKEYKADDIRFKKHRKRGKVDLSPEELEQLRALEPGYVDEELDLDDNEDEDVDPFEAPEPKPHPNKGDADKKNNRERGSNHGQKHDKKVQEKNVSESVNSADKDNSEAGNAERGEKRFNKKNRGNNNHHKNNNNAANASGEKNVTEGNNNQNKGGGRNNNYRNRNRNRNHNNGNKQRNTAGTDQNQ